MNCASFNAIVKSELVMEWKGEKGKHAEVESSMKYVPFSTKPSLNPLYPKPLDMQIYPAFRNHPLFSLDTTSQWKRSFSCRNGQKIQLVPPSCLRAPFRKLSVYLTLHKQFHLNH